MTRKIIRKCKMGQQEEEARRMIGGSKIRRRRRKHQLNIVEMRTLVFGMWANNFKSSA